MKWSYTLEGGPCHGERVTIDVPHEDDPMPWLHVSPRVEMAMRKKPNDGAIPCDTEFPVHLYKRYQKPWAGGYHWVYQYVEPEAPEHLPKPG